MSNLCYFRPSVFSILVPSALAAPMAAFAEVATLDTVEVRVQSDATIGYLPFYSNVATKTLIPLSRTPLSVEVISNDLMQDQGVQSVADALAYTSGISGGYRGKNSILEISVRGIGNKSDGGAIPTYLNGSSFQSAFELNPFFIESVNVIKGPNSILHGQANPGGLVDIITKKANGKERRQIQFVAGTNDRYQLGLDLEGALTENLSTRFIGQLEKAHWKEKYAKEQAGTLSPSLRWTPNEKTSLTLYGYYSKKPKAGYRNFLMREGVQKSLNGQYVPYDFFASDPHYHKLSQEQLHLGYEFSHQLNKAMTFRQNLRYGQNKDYLKGLIAWDNTAGSSEWIRKARIFDDHTREFGVDNQLESQFNLGKTKHLLLAGLEYRYSREDSLAYLGDAPSIDWRHPVYGLTVADPSLQSSDLKKRQQAGFYLQDQIEIGDWDLFIGGRYDRAKTRNQDRLSQQESRDSQGKWSGRVGIIYNFQNGLAPYLTYSTSFVPSAEKDANGEILKPTTAKQWEVGLKYQPNENLLWTLAGFRIQQNDLPNYQWQTRSYEQIGKVETKGIESTFTAKLNDLTLTASYAYLSKQIKQDSEERNLGKTQWGMPDHQGSLWAKYTFTNGISLGAGLRYVGSTFGDNANSFKVPHHTLYDLALGYDLAKLGIKADLQLNVQNLTNKHYVASCANNWTCFYGSERNVNATFNYYF